MTTPPPHLGGNRIKLLGKKIKWGRWERVVERYDRKGKERRKKLKGTEGEGKGRQGGKEGKRKSQGYIFCKILWLGGGMVPGKKDEK